MRLLFIFAQNPWQCLVWWVDGSGSTEVQFVRDDFYNRVILGGMVHKVMYSCKLCLKLCKTARAETTQTHSTVNRANYPSRDFAKS